MPKEEEEAPQTGLPIWAQRLLLALPFLVIFGLLVFNVFSWMRFIRTEVAFHHLADGTCELEDADFRTPLLDLKVYYNYPWSFGRANTSWTNVPCMTDLKVFDTEGHEIPTKHKRTKLYFTYWQGPIPDVIFDTCPRLVPKQAKVGRFSCSYKLDANGVISEGVYVGDTGSLPNYPMLYLMKASGLSACTLGPVLLLLCCCARGWLRRRAQTATSAREASPLGREPLLAAA
mmetsp:Transcript_95439/g.269698  ORF Transcript_95439/g.269698 Transcript_95439/m.269698 type:complete len:231 (-) Transcript_95439:127-819(-)